MEKQVLHFSQPFKLEANQVLESVMITYHTAGRLNGRRDNVIWICHALTASSDVDTWWPGMVGEGCLFDATHYFIVCANMLGSPYGTTCPLDNHPLTHSPYFHDFPPVSIRDMVNAHEILREHLGIQKIQLLIGGSMGGYQALEWCVMFPQYIEKVVLLATAAKESTWGIAIHTTQRMAIEADPSWSFSTIESGRSGLAVARAIGMLTYRGYRGLNYSQQDSEVNKREDFKVSRYLRYQGEKLVKRFNAFSYYVLSKAMDSHNLARERNQSLESLLQKLYQPTFIFSFTEDLLCPPEEQAFLAQHLPNAQLISIKSLYGHDGFLVEQQQIANHIRKWLQPTKSMLSK